MPKPKLKPQTMIAAGLGVFVTGLLLALVAAGGDDDDRASTSGTTQPTIITQAAQEREGQTPAPPQLRIPNGKEAVAIQAGFVSGGGGYAKAGDRVNVFGVFKAPANTPLPPPLAKLVLSNVEVLAVNGPQAGAGTGNVVFVLAVTAAEAEQLIYLNSFESVHVSLVRDGAPPAGGTPGRGGRNIL